MSDYAERPWSWEVPEKASWPAVFSLTLGVFSLVTAEFLPASLLTPMAASLHISQGLSGLLDRLSKPCVKVRRFRQ